MVQYSKMKMNHQRQEDPLVEVDLQVEIVLLVHQEEALPVLLEAVDLQRRAVLLQAAQVVAVPLSVVALQAAALLSEVVFLQVDQVAAVLLSVVALLAAAQVVAALLSEVVLLLVNRAAALQRRAVLQAVALLSAVVLLVAQSAVRQSEILKPQVSI